MTLIGVVRRAFGPQTNHSTGRRLCFTMGLAACLVAHATPSAAAPAKPKWLSQSPVVSDDGFATLRWTVEGSDAITLFRVTESFQGARQVSFTDRPELLVYRIEPGSYVFRIEACGRNRDEYPACGAASESLVLQVRDAVARKSSPEPSVIDPTQAARAAGGPGALRPGLWHNPLRPGHGWSFYWANRLALPETHALHGFDYDLTGFWYTYEAKSRYQDGPPPCGEGGGSGCYWAYADYRPLLARLRLVRTSDTTFQGGIFVTRQGQEVQHGSATVKFGGDNVSATIEWSASFKWQTLSGSDPVQLLAGGTGTDADTASHYAGLWSRAGTTDPLVAADVGPVSEAVEVLFFDRDGDPGWLQAVRSGNPGAVRTDLCFYYVQSGYAPGSSGSVLFHESLCDPDLAVGFGNRNGYREFTAFESARLWLDYVLPDGLRIQIGSSSSPEALAKQANFHRIWFSGTNSCDVSATSPSCGTSLTWFTDGDYTFSDDAKANPAPNASAFAYNQATGQRSLIASSTAPAMENVPVALPVAGTYVFELRMGASASSTLLAQSSPFTVVQVSGSPVAPTGLSMSWTNEANRAYLVQWNHADTSSVNHYALTETLPSGSVTQYTVTPGTSRSKSFSRSSGPYGTYAYRVRACNAGGACSADSPVVQWSVSDPGSSPSTGATQFPWSQNAYGSLVVNQNWNYALGYHFSPRVDGRVTHLGGYFAGAKVVKLFRRSTGTLLAQANVSANNAWSFVAIPPVPVSAGVEYTVAAYLTGSGASYRSGLALPKTYGDITILSGTSANTSSNPNAIPTNSSSTVMYGQADIGFQTASTSQPQPPQIGPIADQQNREGDNVSVQVVATDADGSVTSYADAGTLPPGLVIGNSGLISGRIAAGASGTSPYGVTITATDNAGLTGSRSFTWTVSAQAVAGANPEVPPAPSGPPSMSPKSESSRVGATDGEFQVDESGGSVYRIPILVAPGSGGRAPQLAVGYSSLAGNGPLGVGGSIDGQSAITRCGQTLATDGPGAVRGLTLGPTDRFCLDGKRLIAVAGTYGAPGTEYRTQIDELSRVVSNGRAGSGPESFTVMHRDGSVSLYGATADSRIEARTASDAQTALAWARNRNSDAAGNYIDYVYAELGGSIGDPVEFTLAKVVYTGNDRASTSPYAEVEFIYDASRPDASSAFVAGSRVQQTRLLTRIDSRARTAAGSPMETLRSYQLAYGMDGHGRRILSSVTECRDASRTYCFPPTTFDWLTSRHEIGTSAKSVGSVFDGRHVATAVADVNGDGRPDLLLTRRQNSGFVFEIAPALAGGGFGARGTSYAIPNSGTDTRPVSLHAIDLNADGFQDVLFPHASGWKARLSNGTSLDGEVEVGNGCCGLANPSLVRVMDFDGDGLSDLVTVRSASGGTSELVWLRNLFTPANPTKVGFAAPQGLRVAIASDLFPQASSDGWTVDADAPQFENLSATSAAFARPFDYDGDGTVDLLVRISQRYLRCLANCSADTEALAGVTRDLNRFRIVDDADQPQTLATEPGTAWASFYLVLQSDGAAGFVQGEVVAIGADCTVDDACSPYSSEPAVRRAQPVDINADGLADFAFLDAFYDWRFRLNRGAGFLTPSAPIAAFADDGQSRHSEFIDLTGDQLPDFVYPSAIGSQAAVWILHRNLFGAGFAPAVNTGDAFGNSENSDQSLLLDFTGDGMADNLFIDLDGSGVVLASASKLFIGTNAAGGSPGDAVNVLARISDGLGAIASVNYKPLTDASVYTRMKDSKRANWGGFAVYDLVAPIYVVSQVESSAPTHASATARSRREFHYVGAKLQGGGRGMLGFAEIISYDPQSGIRTHERYRQDFPFIGLPADTATALASTSTRFDRLSNASATSPIAWGAVTATTTAATVPSGKRLSHAINEWRAVETVAGKQVWLPFVEDRLERRYTLTGSFSSKVFTSTAVNNPYGNPDSIVVRTYATDGSTAFATQTTTNTFAVDLAQWRLGRISSTKVTEARNGKTSITRTSAFGYDAATGLLNRETLEPGNATLEVNTNYTLDRYGNRVQTSVTGAGMPARTRTEVYDPFGRYADESRNAYGQATAQVLERDAFGNPLRTENIDGVLTISAADHMGRVFVSWTETGEWSRSLRAAGGGSVCPAGYTAWHITTSGGGSPSRYQCFDVLGREVRSAVQGFDGTLIFADTRYDALGRMSRVSEPYFSNATVYWSETAYDAAGRISAVLAANGNDLVYDYDSAAALCGTAGAGRQTRVTNALGQRKLEIRNALGEVSSVIDNACGIVSYDYDSAGNLVLVTGVDNARTAMAYDLAGRRTSLQDDEKGYWQYAYNALGELTRRLDGKEQAVDFTYDLLGRITARHERSGVSSLADNSFTTINSESTSWINGTSAGVTGKAQAELVTYRTGSSGAVLHQQQLGYDDLGRLRIRSTTQDGLMLAEEMTYDQFGRTFQQFDASGDSRGIRYHYNARGYVERLQEAREGASGMIYQHVRELDERGNVTYMVLGNGVEAFADHDPRTGRLRVLDAYDRNGVELQRIEYEFDCLGNLLQRHDTSRTQDLREVFGYDPMNRLESVILSIGGGAPQETLRMRYDAAGNIASKSDVGDYLYGAGAAGPHAVTSAGNTTYTYDTNGNQLSSSDNRKITYTAFDQAVRIQKGSDFTEFTYGIGNHRIKRVDGNAIDGSRTTWYFGSVERIQQSGQNAYFRRSIGDVAVVDYFPATQARDPRYLLKDHLGSIHSVIDDAGLVQSAVAMNFGAWGERQNATRNAPIPPSGAQLHNLLTSRGFTGHEHADGLGIVHMNGRIYDPRLGRFLQADPHVQDATDSQSLNRYTYALNNPLSITDPTGYFSFSRFFKKWGRVVVAGIAAYFTYGAASGWAAGWLSGTALAGNGAIAGAVAGAVSGTVAGAILTGSATGTIRGAVAGAVLAGISGYFASHYSVTRIGAEALGGGISAMVSGGKFSDGLKFAFIVSALNYANFSMRNAERNLSERHPEGFNTNGKSTGFYGDGTKLAGAREQLNSAGERMPCVSPAGGCQGAPINPVDQASNFFGSSYSPGDIRDIVNESFAGPHDWLRNNVSRSYIRTPSAVFDIVGNMKNLSGFRLQVDRFANAALIPAAAPFAFAGIVTTQVPLQITAMQHLYSE